MGIVRKTGTKILYYEFWYEGRRYSRTTGETDDTKAEAVEAKRKAELTAETAKRHARVLLGQTEPAVYKPGSRMSLDKALGRYNLEVARHQSNAKTTEAQLANLERIIGGHVMLDEIGGNNITSFIERRRGEPSKRSPKKGPVRYMGPASVNREIEVLRATMLRARDKWDVPIPKMPKWGDYMLPEPDAPESVLTDDQEDSVRFFLRRDIRNFFDFSLLSLMRKTGQINLKKSQVDLHARTIKLKVKSRKHAGGRNVVVRITERMRAILLAEWPHHPTVVFTYVAHRRSKDRVPGQRYPLTASAFKRLWKAATKAAGVPDHRWHDNRHTGATRLGQSSKDLAVVQKALTHADIQSTMRYRHTTEDNVLEAMETLHAKKSPVRPTSRPTSRSAKRLKA